MRWLQTIIDDAAAGLLTSRAAQDYLALRQVPLALAAENKVGWLPADYVVASCPSGFAYFQKEKLRERMVFPFFDLLGRPCGLITRSPAEKVFEKFVTGPGVPSLFGLPRALQTIYDTEVVIVVEGPFDCLAVQELLGPGAPVVACLTADVPRATREFCWRFATTVVALFDQDEPGQKAGAKLSKSLPGVQVVVPWYPAHDPDDLVHRTAHGEHLAARLRPLFAHRSSADTSAAPSKPVESPINTS